MTREEAIERLKSFDLIGSNEDIEFQYALDMGIEALEKINKIDKIAHIRSVEDLNGLNCEEVILGLFKTVLERWIPVSERLPELNRPLLVTAYHRVYYGHLISESGNYGYPVFRIHGLGDKNRDWVQETMSHEPYSLGRIDAWMYFDIPEPYKASPTGEEVEE